VERETPLAVYVFWIAAAVALLSLSVVAARVLMRWQRSRARLRSALQATPLLVPFPQSHVRPQRRQLRVAHGNGTRANGEAQLAGFAERTLTLPHGGLADRAAPRESTETVRLDRPAETLQVLPGRLEVVEGDQSRDIRLVRSWDDVPEITIGRTPGPDSRHVQLQALTVSRAHARLRFEGERWRIVNLSDTNPTVVNGAALAPQERRQLGHGDRIELGEVVLRFWER
jgi:hypothetical protein